ncbi:MAG: hypothetical protein ACFFFK_10285, partial [Candidatus Thorarchaeota archaeon]
TLRIIGWSILFTLFPTYCLLIDNDFSTPWFAPVWLLMFLGPIFISPSILYFFFRRWLIARGTSTSIIGERSRIEAVGDLLLLCYVLYGINSSLLLFRNPNYLLEQAQYIFDLFGNTGMQFYLMGYLSSLFLIIIGIGIRLIGDCLEFRTSRRTATRLMVISGTILIISLTVRSGIDILSNDYLLFPFIYYPVILFLVFVVAFQVETSKLKINKKSGTLTIIESSPVSAYSGEDVQRAYDKSEQTRKYQGN